MSNLKLNLQSLLRLSLFEGLSPEQAAELLTVATLLPLASGQVVFEEGTAGDALYVLLEGKVEIRKRSREGPRTLAVLEKDAVFGELALFTAEPRTAAAVIIADARLLRLSREDFLNLLLQGNRMAVRVVYNLGKVLADRITVMNRTLMKLQGES
jgi:CRP-like cAMP-binding protein